jgi:hypothetical protein
MVGCVRMCANRVAAGVHCSTLLPNNGRIIRRPLGCLSPSVGERGCVPNAPLLARHCHNG